MKNFILMAILTALFFSCAKPNYQKPEESNSSLQNTDPSKNQEPKVEQKCDLFLTQQRLCVQFTWEKKPANADETGSFNFKFYIEEKPNTFVEPRNTPAVQLWMPSMGHGSSPVKIEKINEGQYKATNVFFIMPGEWEIRIQLKDGKNVIDQVIKKITL